MKAFAAYKIADRIKAELQPMCERIEIAGSLRRGRPEVNDIDLVILPRPGQLAAIKARCEQKCTVVRNGDQNYIVRLPERGGHPSSGLQVDIFFAHHGSADMFQKTPSNWGTLLLCRTGSKEHNIYLVEHAKTRGFTWSPYKGVLDGEGFVIASATEEEIFDMLGLSFVPPANRER